MPDNSFLDVLVNFLMVDFRTATPILLAAIGLIFMERSGVVNIGCDGMMLIGSLAAVAGSFYLGNVWLGALVAALTTAVIGIIFAYFVVTVKANQVVIGVAINILALGLTTTVARVIFGVNSAPPQVDTFDPIVVPLLSKIPIIGDAIFNQMAPVYIALLLVPLAHTILFKTSIGLKIRAVGEHPKAAATVGINVSKVRYATIIGGSILSGLAGAYLSLGLLSFFTENMVAGRGFIALAAVIFGKYTPLGTLGATLLFGAGDAVSYRLQALGSDIPYQFILMLPYLLTIAALAGFVGKAIPQAKSSQS